MADTKQITPYGAETQLHARNAYFAQNTRSPSERAQLSSRVKASGRGRCSLPFFGLLRTAASKAPVCSPDADAADSRQIYEGERGRLEQKVALLAANGLSGPSIHRHAATAGRCRRNTYVLTDLFYFSVTGYCDFQ